MSLHLMCVYACCQFTLYYSHCQLVQCNPRLLGIFVSSILAWVERGTENKESFSKNTMREQRPMLESSESLHESSCSHNLVLTKQNLVAHSLHCTFPLKATKNSVIQCVKKVLSDSPGVVDFPVGLVSSIHDLPEGQVTFLDFLLGR